MLLKLILFFTLIPLSELFILMKLGANFGVGITLLIVIGTGFIGALLARGEGYRVLFKIQHEMNSGKLPANHILEASLIFVAGIVLIIPGVLTDVLGLFLLIPSVRAIILNVILKKLEASNFYKNYKTHNHHPGNGPRDDGGFIDGEFKKKF